MPSDQELQNTFKLTQEEGNIVAVSFPELLTEESSNEQAKLVVESVEEIFSKNPQTKFGFLVDLSPMKFQPSFLTGESRVVYEEFAQNKQLGKVAIIGGNLFYKVTTNFLMTASRRGSDIKWFTDKKEAFSWLRKE